MIKFYNNHGKTIDQYSMYVAVKTQRGLEYDIYTMSDNPLSPQGVNMFGGTVDSISKANTYSDKEVCFDDLPDEVQKAVAQRLYPETSSGVTFHEEKGIVCSNCNK